MEMEINKVSEDRKYKWNMYHPPPPRKDRIKVIIVDKTHTHAHTHTRARTHAHTHILVHNKKMTPEHNVSTFESKFITCISKSSRVHDKHF